MTQQTSSFAALTVERRPEVPIGECWISDDTPPFPVSREFAASAEGIDSRENIRKALIELRDALLGADEPRFEYVVLLSHAIWWLD